MRDDSEYAPLSPKAAHGAAPGEDGHARDAAHVPDGRAPGAPAVADGVTAAERSALHGPAPRGPWWAAFPPRFTGAAPRSGRLVAGLAAVVTALVLAAAGAAAYWVRDDPPRLVLLATVPTALAFLWGVMTCGRFAAAGRGFLAGTLLLVPLNLLANTIWPAGDVAVTFVFYAVALAVVLTAAGRLRMPAFVGVGLSMVALAAMSLLARDELLLSAMSLGGVFEFVLLGFFALGASGIVFRLLLRRREMDEQSHLAAKIGFLALLWSVIIACVYLLAQPGAAVLDPRWIGPWMIALGSVLLAGGLVFMRPAGADGQIRTRAFGIVLVALSGVAALSGLALADRFPVAMQMGLAAIFVVTLLLGARLRGKASTPFRAMASVSLPLVMACAAMVASDPGLPDGQGLFGRMPASTNAAAGLSVGATLVYLFGLAMIPRQRRWTHSVPAVAGLALGLVGYFHLAMLGGSIALALPGSQQPMVLENTVLMSAVAGLMLLSAWRINWQPAVYLGALGLLIATGVYAANHAAMPPVVDWLARGAAAHRILLIGILLVAVLFTRTSTGARFRVYAWPLLTLATLVFLLYGLVYLARQGPLATDLVRVALSVAAAGIVSAALGAGLSALRERVPLARFYAEGPLVMGLAATTLMTLTALAGAGSWQLLASPTSLALLVGLAWTLLLCAMVFRQEDLFGFFGLAVVLIALTAFAVYVGPQEGRYLLRYQTVGLGVGILLAAVSSLLAVRLRGREGFGRLGAALYVIAFAVAVAVLVALPLTGSLAWRGFDLVGVAVILGFIRPHVRHPATGYVVAAAATAAIFQFVAGAWGHSPQAMHEASLMAAGALSVALVVTAHCLRHVLLALTRASDKEARRRSRPFTVVGMAVAVALAVYLAAQTTLAYCRILSGAPVLPWLTGTFNPAAGLLAWVGVVLAFLVSIWLFRHSARTLGFFLIGSAATISIGPVLTGDPYWLLSYLICAIGGYGAVHLLVYLWERPYMAMLSRHCALYKDEQHASTTIFTASAIVCFIGGGIAAFHIYTPAALVMLSLLTGVFFIWSFGQRRSEFVYPMVLVSIGALLSIWHNVEGPGPWTAGRLNMNALVFALGGPSWLGVGTALNRLRGPMGLLNAPARQMSVLLAVVGLGFFVALAVCPTWSGAQWRADDAPDRFIFGTLCGAVLVVHFLWAAVSFRRTVLVYLGAVSLLVTLVFLAARIAGIRHSQLMLQYWPLAAAILSVVLLGLSHLLERRRLVLFGRPLFYTAVFFLPLLTAGGLIVGLVRSDYGPASMALFVLAATLLLGRQVRLAVPLLVLAALAMVAAAAAWYFSGLGLTAEAVPQMLFGLLPLMVAAALAIRRPWRKRLRKK